MPRTTQFDGQTFVAIDAKGGGQETRYYVNPAGLERQRDEFLADMLPGVRAQADAVIDAQRKRPA